MVIEVFKALDKPSSLFSIKGSYIKVFIALIGISLILALVVGSFTSSLVGTLVFIVLVVFSYFGVLQFQARFSEKERDKWLSSRELPSFIRMKPVPFGRMVRRGKTGRFV